MSSSFISRAPTPALAPARPAPALTLASNPAPEFAPGAAAEAPESTASDMDLVRAAAHLRSHRQRTTEAADGAYRQHRKGKLHARERLERVC